MLSLCLPGLHQLQCFREQAPEHSPSLPLLRHVGMHVLILSLKRFYTIPMFMFCVDFIGSKVRPAPSNLCISTVGYYYES